MNTDANGESIDAPPAPDYEADQEELFDLGVCSRVEWRKFPLWAKLRLLRRLRTEGSGRPEQYIDPTLEWYLWLMLAGRGSGKSDEASRWTSEEALRLPGIRFALVARTFGDARDSMFEGETGVLSVLPDEVLRGGSRDKAYNRSLGELYLANGTKLKGFSSEKPSSLRGPQHHRAWVDEISSWEDAQEGNKVDTTISNLMLGLRLKPSDGSGVRFVGSSTPKPNELTIFLHDLAEKKGYNRSFSTVSNLKNLDDAVADVILGMYEGTDVGEQELEGKILASVKGAAWTTKDIEAAKKIDSFGEAKRRILGIDPAVTSKTGSDETGLVVVVEEEIGTFVKADHSCILPAGSFGGVVVSLAEEEELDLVVVEINNGYDFVVNAITTEIESAGGTAIRRARQDRKSVKSKVRQVIEYVCETANGHSFILKPVWQSVDKLTRAKAASLHWQRLSVRHAPGLDQLEQQMTTFDGTAKKSPDRLDALTSAMAEVSSKRLKRAASGGSPLHIGDSGDEATHPLLQQTTAGAGHPLLN